MPVLWITPEELDEPTHEQAPLVAEAVSYILYVRSGRKYPGVKEVTEWYGVRGAECWACPPPGTADGIYDAVHQHRYLPSGDKGLRTRGRPITAVSEVSTSSGILDPSEYQVANRAVIYRTDRRAWGFSTGVTVTYSYGTYPPSAGKLAALRLGNELLMGFTDPENCALPSFVTNVNRQNISFAVKGLGEYLAAGSTGIAEVDLFLATVNPTGARQPARLFKASSPRGERYL